MCECTIIKQCNQCKKPELVSSWDMFADAISTTNEIVKKKTKEHKTK